MNDPVNVKKFHLFIKRAQHNSYRGANMLAIDFLEPICGRMTSQGFTWHYMKLADSFSKDML